jgi:hypothetical protein
MRRGGDVLISAGVLGLVLVALAAMDERVRVRFGTLLRGASGSDAGGLAEQVQSVGGTLFVALWDQSVANAPLTIFVVVAALLTVFMLRT